MKLAAYLRVSTDAQAERGYGLDGQRSAIKGWTKAHGHRVALWAADEGISGSNGIDTRQGLYEALEAVRDGVCGGLVVYSLDRLARSLTVQEAVLAKAWEAGAAVFTVDQGELLEDDPDDPMRTAMRQMRGVFSELDRAMITKRMRDGKRAKAAQGGYVGGAPPFGFRAEGGALVPDEAEQRVLGRIRELRAEGLSTRAICSRLDAEGIRPKHGDRWQSAVVARILRRDSTTR